MRGSGNGVSDIVSTVLLLSCALAFLVPFSLGRNIDLQSMVLILIGAMAWSVVALDHKQSSLAGLPRFVQILLGVYVLSCLLSLAWHPGGANLFGAPLLGLGSLGLTACVGCGLALRSVDNQRLTQWLYGTTVLLAVSAIPYALLVNHHLGRLGGVFDQSDILAVFMACGLLLGLAMWNFYPTRRPLLILAQCLLVVILFGTQTRAVILLVALIALLLIWQGQTDRRRRNWEGAALAVGFLAVIIVLPAVLPGRLSNSGYARESIHYRLVLQQAALRASWREPLQGFGPGSIDTALACPTLHDPALQATCHEAYYFNSSHNIFLDRVLGLGWIGGIAYSLLVGLALREVFRIPQSKAKRSMLYCVPLIAAYYLTNVTNVELELWFWILILQAFRPVKPPSSHNP